MHSSKADQTIDRIRDMSPRQDLARELSLQVSASDFKVITSHIRFRVNIVLDECQADAGLSMKNTD